ncbi:MAG: hypothetical protein COX40_04275, partial [Candidatus Omnitrophica bacterium CG23_combo_of_CG06-09_8_20_14_all_40_11]
SISYSNSILKVYHIYLFLQQFLLLFFYHKATLYSKKGRGSSGKGRFYPMALAKETKPWPCGRPFYGSPGNRGSTGRLKGNFPMITRRETQNPVFRGFCVWHRPLECPKKPSILRSVKFFLTQVCCKSMVGDLRGVFFYLQP